ncbi:phosphatase PAP2 family protein [Bacteroidia bacterium]|nr:phosphatase PAP2 family protein [Bacteroidia bacterium]
MLVKIAQFISYLFHPLFTTFYLSVLGIFFHPTIRGRVVNGFVWQLILLLFASLVLIPMMSLFIVKKSGYISSWKIENRKERIIPFAIVGLMMFISSIQLLDNSALVYCGNIALAASIGLVVSIPFLIYCCKPSAHVMAIAAGATAYLKEGFTWYSNDLLLIGTILILLVGIIASARLFLNAHTFPEILLGALIGILVILPIL